MDHQCGSCSAQQLRLLGLPGVVDAASKELSGMGGGGRDRRKGDVRRAEKRWRTTEKGQGRKDRKK